MVQPFQYLTGGQDPVAALQSGMAFGQQMRAGEQAQAMNAQNMELAASQEARAQTAFQQQNTLFDQQQQDRAAGLEATRLMNVDLAALSEKVAAGTVTSADFAAIATKYPDLATEMGALWEGQASERKDADVAELFKGITALKAGRPDLAIQMLEERAVAAENSGDKMEADIARATAAAIQADPAAGMTSLGLLLQVVDPDAAKTVFGEGKTVQSTIPYENGTTVTVFTDGSKQVSDAAGNVLAGDEALAIIEAAQANEAEARGMNANAAQGGKLDAEIGKVGEVEAEKKAAANNQEIVKSANAALATISSTIRNYDDALTALDQGANTGVAAARLPVLTDAGALLENAKLRLGLDVIASVTFGALSEGERAAAMQTALPTNLSEQELYQWIKTRQAAEAKIAAVQKKAIDHFSQPGKSQRELAREWVEAYSATIPGVKDAFAAQFGADEGGSQAAPAVPADIDALLQEAAGL